jgi:hypothetical protein
MKLTPATTLAAAAIIGVAGFFVGRLSSPESSDAKLAQEVQAAVQRQSPRTSADGTGRVRETGGETLGSASDRQAVRHQKLEEILRGENALDRNRALLAFIDQLAPGDFEAAIAHFRTLGLTDDRLGEYSLLLTAWAKVDPLSALEDATKNTSGNFASSTILASWATTDPDAALRWAQENHQGAGANPFLIGVIRGIAETDPARATELLAGMPFSNERGQALEGIMQHILKQGPQAARDWISALTDDRLREGAVMRMSEQMASIDPQGTADWLLAHPGQAASRRLDDVYNTWASANETAALDSFSALPAGESRTNALRGVIDALAEQNPQRALAVMDQYPSDVNDGVLQTFIRSATQSDPNVAVSAIPRITNEGQRNNAYRRTLDRWMRQDTEAAVAWVQQNPLPENVQQRFFRQVERLRERSQ